VSIFSFPSKGTTPPINHRASLKSTESHRERAFWVTSKLDFLWLYHATQFWEKKVTIEKIPLIDAYELSYCWTKILKLSAKANNKNPIPVKTRLKVCIKQKLQRAFLPDCGVGFYIPKAYNPNEIVVSIFSIGNLLYSVISCEWQVAPPLRQ